MSYGETTLNNTDPQIPITGFVAKTYDEILTDLITNCQKQFNGSVDVSPASPLYILLQGVADEYSTMWETLEGMYYSRNIETAIGTELDNVGLSVALPRYRPTKSSGTFEFTRLRDPVTGVFFRVDQTTGTLISPAPYIYYYCPGNLNRPCKDYTPEYLQLVEKSRAYTAYFTRPLPKITIPEDLVVTVTGDTPITYTVQNSGIINSDVDASNAYTVSLPVESTVWGTTGDMSEYYKRCATFNGAISVIVPNSLNPYISPIANVYQMGSGITSVIPAVTTVRLKLTRSNPTVSEVIVSNGWHYYDTTAPQANGKYDYVKLPQNMFTPDEIEAEVGKAMYVNPLTPVGDIMANMTREWLKKNDDYYYLHQDEVENLALKWVSPDNSHIFNMDFRNIAVDDDTTWFIPNPKKENDLLFTYFRPTYTRSQQKTENSLDYLVFRPVANISMSPDDKYVEVIAVYAGFGGTSEDFYSADAIKKVKGYIGPNHIAISDGSDLLPSYYAADMNELYCRPKVTVTGGYNLNVGYALQESDITGGRDFESDEQYRFRIMTTRYNVTSTGKAIEQYVAATKGVISAQVYDSNVDPDDPLSIGFKVRIRTDDTENIYLDNRVNTATGKLVNNLVKLVKPAGVQYMFDSGNGYGIKVKVVVIGSGYPNSIIIDSIKDVLRNYMKSLSQCKPLDYSYLVEYISNCAKGVKVVKSLEIFNGKVISGDEDTYITPSDNKRYVTSPFRVTTFEDPVYLPPRGYAYWDESVIEGEESSKIEVVNEKVIHYGGCGRSNSCY